MNKNLIAPQPGIPSDPVSFATFYQQYKEIGLKMIMSLDKRRSQEAEDIIQNIFLHLWRRRERLPKIHCFKNYLFIIVRKQLFKEEQRSRRRYAALADLEVRVVFSNSLTINEYFHRECWQLLQQNLRQLPPRARQTFTKRRLQGERLADIAAEMGISPLTVVNHLKKADIRIRAIMQ